MAPENPTATIITRGEITDRLECPGSGDDGLDVSTLHGREAQRGRLLRRREKVDGESNAEGPDQEAEADARCGSVLALAKGEAKCSNDY